MVCSGCGEDGHNIRTCSVPTATSESNKKDNKKRNNSPNGNKISCCGICKKSGHNSKTCPIEDNKEAEIIENTIKKERLCGFCKKSGHDKRTCPEREKTELKSKGKINEEAMSRIKEGPTEQDGPGYVYIYCLKSPKSSIEERLFKIGMSEKLPERRVHKQEKHNKEQYQLLYSMTVAWRKLTEKVIHYALKDLHYHRDVADGGTEWFKGDQNQLKDVMKYVRREINAQFPVKEPIFGCSWA